MATKAKPGTAIKNWDAELAAMAAETAKAEESGGGGQFVSLKSGQLRYNDNPVPGNKMNVVVVDSAYENVYYEGDYDPDNRAGPVCFAFARTDGELAPHEKASKPQHATCKGCPQNEFGSAERGKGKACKNVRRLALITEDAAENAEEAEVAYMKVPVTSVKNWAGYVQQLNSTVKRPPVGVVTEISVVPDAKSQFKVLFKLAEVVNDSETMGGLLGLRKAQGDNIMFPYSATSEDEAPAKPAGRNAKFAKRK